MQDSIEQVMEDELLSCKWCKEPIAKAACVCKECNKHQNRILFYLENVGPIIAAVMLLLSILQFISAKEEVAKAQDAVEKAEASLKIGIAASNQAIKAKENAETALARSRNLEIDSLSHSVNSMDLIYRTAGAISNSFYVKFGVAPADPRRTPLPDINYQGMALELHELMDDANSQKKVFESRLTDLKNMVAAESLANEKKED